MRDRYGARDARSLKLRFHAQTSGCSLTWQQPDNNVVRTSLQALAAVLGGAQSLHTNSLDEAFALPSERAATLALRTQQVIACESGITAVPDPFGGSWFLERLTLDLEAGASDYIRRIDDMGGMIEAIKLGFPQAEIARASYEFQQKIERTEAVIIGVNRFRAVDEQPIETLRIDQAAEDRQIEKLRRLRKERNKSDVESSLRALRRTATPDTSKTSGCDRNLMPLLLDAVRSGATLGEICGALREVFGTYEERPNI
jgi:methylmalonyl-CoA mutase N-terminal domain/subunit